MASHVPLVNEDMALVLEVAWALIDVCCWRQVAFSVRLFFR